MDVGIDQAGDCPESLAIDDGCAIRRSLGVRFSFAGLDVGELAVLDKDGGAILGCGAGAVDEGDVGDE